MCDWKVKYIILSLSIRDFLDISLIMWNNMEKRSLWTCTWIDNFVILWHIIHIWWFNTIFLTMALSFWTALYLPVSYDWLDTWRIVFWWSFSGPFAGFFHEIDCLQHLNYQTPCFTDNSSAKLLTAPSILLIFGYGISIKFNFLLLLGYVMSFSSWIQMNSPYILFRFLILWSSVC